MTSIFDAMPVSILETLERMEITISDMERQAFVLQANAQDLRSRHEDIISSWKARADREGLGNLIEVQQRLDAIAWVIDPLPSGIAVVVRERGSI